MLACAWVFVSLPAVAAERVAVRLWRGAGSGVPEAERVLAACEDRMHELTGLTVLRAAQEPGAGRCGAREDCLRALAREPGTEHVLVVELASRRPGFLEVDLAWVDTVRGEVARRSLTGVTPATLERDLRPGVAVLVPDFARKGWGGLVVPGTGKLRVDGRMAGSGEVLALTAGPHEVDLLPPSGGAWLTREEIHEGVRLSLAPAPQRLPGEVGAERTRGGGLRAASFATFSLGALAVAGGLVAGGLSRGALAGLRPCTDNPRDCTSFSEASAAYARAGRDARVGNALLGGGAGLVGVGAGLFVFDVLSTPSGK